MEKREKDLGFKTQKETRYNKFLPYSECLDAESNHQLAEIKTNLGLAVQTRDVKIAVTHWTGQLTKYIRLYGLKFSKEDHLVFIKLLFELIAIPDLDYSLVSKFSNLLVTLLKKKELLTRDDLTLPWRPLYKLLKNVAYSPYEHHGLVYFPQNIETVLKNLIKVSRVYFAVESTQEMLDEWRPLMCVFDVTMLEATYFFSLFLPTKLTAEEHERGYKLWFEEFFNLWDGVQNSPTWEKDLVCLFSRLAYDTVGQIDWNPHMAKIFTRILRSMNLPVGSGKVHISRAYNIYDVNVTALWIIHMMGGAGNTVQGHLDNLWVALESFYHPSNYGKWSGKLLKFMQSLSRDFVKRIHRERLMKEWDTPIPDSHKLQDEEITAFVKTILPIVLVGMFSKTGPEESRASFQQLVAVRPEIVIPPLLERTYPALETLTEPHRLVACLHCLVAVWRPMLTSTKWYPEGRGHVIPILNLCLPGIDPNDIKKTLATFQIMSTLTNHVPIVDCSDAVHLRDDLTDVERELCSATAQFEDFVCQFMDRIFTLIENNAQEHVRADSSRVTTLAPQETMIEVGLRSTFNGIAVMSSPAIYDEMVRRLFRFVSTNVYEYHVAGRFTAHLLKAVAKTDPEKALKTFLKHFCDVLISRCSDEGIAKLEHLDEEILWNLKLLVELVRCDGLALLTYIDDVMRVLRLTLHVKCKDTADLAGSLVNHVLRALTLTYCVDRKGSPYHWQESLEERLPIREWGKHCDLETLDVDWHVPTDAEKEAAKQILIDVLLPELERFRAHMAGDSLEREELKQRLSIVCNCLMGASSILPMWKGDPVVLVESRVKLTKFNNSASADEEGISLDGKNFRTIVAEALRPLLDHMLLNGEDDTKSLNLLTKIYSALMFYNGCQRTDLDSRWKAFHGIKKSMANKLFGKKAHLRAILIDRIQLQQELRVINRSAKIFTTLHRDLFTDLFKLSTSRYSEVRKIGQQVLGKGLHMFAFSYRALLASVLRYLTNGDDVQHHQYKGALYVVLGENKQCLMTKRNWEVMSQIWPTVVNSKHSEKPSIIKLLDTIIAKLHKNIETTEVAIKVHDRLLEVSESLWSSDSNPKPTQPPLTEEAKHQGARSEAERNSQNARMYTELAEKLVAACNSGNLNWKYHQMALDMLKLLTRPDIALTASAVKLFVDNMVHDTLQVRKISLLAVSAILKSQKRPHVTVAYDPYEVTKSTPPDDSSQIHPGDRVDNVWHHYSSDNLLDTKEKYESALLVEKTHWGYYTWPKEMKRYAPICQQPVLGRKPDAMSAAERAIYESFMDENYVTKVLDYLALEEQKGKDKFHSHYFQLFKGLFRNYDSAFLSIFRTHLERLVNETSREKHEYSHRLASEIIAGLIRGSKHWDFDRVDAMWKWLGPLIRTGIATMSVECMVDWGTAFATASESRDPRKLHYMLELLMIDPLSGEGGSFGDESRLYILQGALAQQEWRVPVLLNKVMEYIKPHLAHHYKNVRDRLGSFLVNVMMCELELPHFAGTNSPKQNAFIQGVLPQLQILKDAAGEGTVKNGGKHDVIKMAADVAADGKRDVTKIETMETEPNCVNNTENGESEERKAAVRLCKTVMKYLQGGFTRNFSILTPEVFKLLPILCVVPTHGDFADDEAREELRETFKALYEIPLSNCHINALLDTVAELSALQSEAKDEELKNGSLIAMAFLSHALLGPEVIPTLLSTANEVAEMRSWHARAAILHYLQVTIFCNLFLMQAANTKQHIEQLIIRLMCDEQLEVRQTAAETLGGLLHCGYFTVTPALMSRFEKLASTRVKKKKHDSTPVSAEKIVLRHAGVLGLCACVQAYPYDVPEVVPQILMDLSGHLDDPQPIQMTVKKTLSNFKRTHYDNWHDHKRKFTDDQLVVLTDLLVSPSYYA